MAKLKLDIVTPEKILYASEANMVVVPGVEGDIGVLKDHSPLISTLRPGRITIFESENKVENLFVYKGFAEVTADKCTILADEAINLKDYSKEQAEARLNKAKQHLEDPDFGEEQSELLKELDLAKNLLELF